MSHKLHHHLLKVSVSLGLLACSDDGPCLEGGEDGECIAGETGDEISPLCAPDPSFESGTSMTCQGQGSGWLVTDVYGAGNANPLTSCLAYDAESIEDIPQYPTSEDCASIPFDLIPYDVPPPTACCGEAAPEEDIIDTCMLDCGYAACKTAIEAIRASADALVAPSPIFEKAYDTSKADLHAFADLLESPIALKYCASKVSASPSEVVSLGLGEGPSSNAEFGHIKEATLYLGCGLDPDEPYVSNPTIGECTDPTNIPTAMDEQESQGLINEAAITVAGPGVDTVAAVTNASVSTREVLNRDMSVDFTLTAFEAAVVDAKAGSFEFRNAAISLVAPASATLEGETVRFAPGTLRFAVTAEILVDGEPLFDGQPMTAEYGNSATATAIRGLDGTFHFVDATFTTGEYTAVLNTQPSVLHPVQ